MNPAQCPPPFFQIEKQLAHAFVVGSTITAATVVFQVRNPSVRLHCTLYVYARPDRVGTTQSQGPAHDYTGETWQLFAESDSTPEEDLNWVFDAGGVNTPRPLPDSYEFETGIKVINGLVALQKNAGNVASTYYVRAVWEPAAGGTIMSDQERADLYALCDLTTPSAVLNISC